MAQIISHRALKRRVREGIRDVTLQRGNVTLDGKLDFGDVHHANGKEVFYIETIGRGQPDVSPTYRNYHYSYDVYDTPLRRNDVITVIENCVRRSYKVKL